MSAKRLILIPQIEIWLDPYYKPNLSRMPHQSLTLKYIQC